jgi:hypothetical protein
MVSRYIYHGGNFQSHDVLSLRKQLAEHLFVSQMAFIRVGMCADIAKQLLGLILIHSSNHGYKKASRAKVNGGCRHAFFLFLDYLLSNKDSVMRSH